jgi:phosphatidylglycerol lysyltransferase
VTPHRRLVASLRRRLGHIEGPSLWLLGHASRGWPVIAIAVILWFTWDALRAIHIRDVRTALGALDDRWVWAAAALTALNVAVMGLYDVVAFRHTRSPALERWRYGAISFAWSNFLTLGPLAGPAIRFWLYAPAIDRAADLQGGVLAIAMAFVSGLAGWSAAITIAPRASGGFALTATIALGCTLIAVLVARWVLLAFDRVSGPGFRATRPFEMALVGWLDWLLASAAFLCAVRAAMASPPNGTLRTFFWGQIVGLVSLVPGGFGSADAYWIARLPAAGATAAAAVSAFRLVYYVLPWGVASLVLLSWATRRAQRRVEIARRVVASLTGAGGLLIMLSSASPALHARLLTLERLVPLPFIELGHLSAAMIGLLLLAIARGLARGYRAAFRTTLVLLWLGALSALLKGFDWEEAAVLGGLSIAAASHAALFDRKSSGTWIEGADVALATAALAVFVVFGVLTHRAGFGAFQRWMELGYRLEASRFARSAIALSVAVAAAALYVALRVPVRFERPSGTEVGRALDLHARIGGNSTPLMIANGDKAILLDDPRGWCAYRIIGPYLVVFADPIVRAAERNGFLDAVFQFAGELDRRPLFYQLSPDWIPPLHDRGYVFFKLGEEAQVSLARVGTEGPEGKLYRQVLRRAERDGLAFRVMPPYEVEKRMAELREISDDWLHSKGVAERQFSIGFFDEAYLSRWPCGVVEHEGKIVAFANLLRGPQREEFSVDLMRYRSEGPKVMDFLFVSLFFHAKSLGYQRFNLGMAPLASVGQRKGAHARERFASLLFQHGEHWYNFQGLRFFKQKFEPEWVPRYMGYQSAWEFPIATAYVSALIAGGWRRVAIPHP